MDKFEALQHFENCYDAMRPAAEKSDQAFVWFSDIPHFLFNAVMHLSCNDVSSKIDALIERAPVGNSISFWVHPENRANGLVEMLKERGFTPMIACPLMTWSVKPIAIPECDIRLANMETFDQITKTVFHFDEITMKKYSALIKNFDSENYLIFAEGQPIGTGILFPNGKVGGIFNIAILPEYQRKGYGQAMMRFLMGRAQHLHLEHLILLSSPQAKTFYRNLGFEKIFDIDIYAR